MVYASAQTFPVDLALSDSPLGASEKVKSAIATTLDRVHCYPDPTHQALRERLGEIHNIEPSRIHVGAGAGGILQKIVIRLTRMGTNIVIPDATFPVAALCATALGGDIIKAPLQTDLGIDFDAIRLAINPKTKLIFIANPNNPTGILEGSNKIREFASSVSIPVIVSEANIEFTGDSLLELDALPRNLIVLRSFSKAHCLASLRIGYAVATEEWIDALNALPPIIATGELASAAALAALEDDIHLQKVIDFVHKEGQYLSASLDSMGFEVVPSRSNIFIFRVRKSDRSADDLLMQLRAKGCNAVTSSAFSSTMLSDQYLRIAPRSRDINQRFLDIIAHV